MNDDDEPDDSGQVSWRTGLISILGFWAFYTAIVTLRAAVVDFPSQGEMAMRRGLVSVVGIVANLLLWMLLRQFDRQRLIVRVAVALIACIPAALAFSAANYYFFNVYDAGLLPDVEQMAGAQSLATEIIETAFWRYFIMISWAALYLALSYAEGVRVAERRAARFARAAQTAELRALRYQINPHFLFNTLNSLSALVMKGDKQSAETMIMNIATFYRSSLAGDSIGDTSLADEIALQQRYLEIEKVRFPGRLGVKIDLPDALGNCAVPGLILQPLVENAIKHGVSQTVRPVTLTLSAREDSGQLLLRVADDAQANNSGGGGGIGIANVRDRLVARYGSSAQLTAGAVAGGYAAELRLPLERMND